MTTPLEVLRQRGWNKGAFEGPNGEVCIGGAINVAQGRRANDCGEAGDEKRDAYESAWRPIAEVIREQFPDYGPGVSIVQFNDDRRTTFADVEAVLEKTAQRLADEQVTP